MDTVFVDGIGCFCMLVGLMLLAWKEVQRSFLWMLAMFMMIALRAAMTHQTFLLWNLALAYAPLLYVWGQRFQVSWQVKVLLGLGLFLVLGALRGEFFGAGVPKVSYSLGTFWAGVLSVFWFLDHADE